MIIIAGLIAAFVIIAVLNWRHGPRRACRWREDRAASKDALRKYHCIACGAEAFTATKGPPRQCKAGRRPPTL